MSLEYETLKSLMTHVSEARVVVIEPGETVPYRIMITYDPTLTEETRAWEFVPDMAAVLAPEDRVQHIESLVDQVISNILERPVVPADRVEQRERVALRRIIEEVLRGNQVMLEPDFGRPYTLCVFNQESQEGAHTHATYWSDGPLSEADLNNYVDSLTGHLAGDRGGLSWS
jgi:hypothetical protein